MAYEVARVLKGNAVWSAVDSRERPARWPSAKREVRAVLQVGRGSERGVDGVRIYCDRRLSRTC